MILLLTISVFLTKPLLLLNLLVVGVAAAGWFTVARFLSQRSVVAGDIAYFGLSLIVLGGAGRSLWTICSAVWGLNITWLGNILFPLLGPGFICLAWAVRLGLRTPRHESLARAWLMPIVLMLTAFALAVGGETYYAGRGWVLVMLSFTTLANCAAILQLIVQAVRERVPLAVVCYLIHLIATFALAGMPGQTIPLQIVKQSINILAQLTFLAAALILQRRARTPAVSASPPARILRILHTT